MMEGPVRTVLVLACLLSVQPWLAGTAHAGADDLLRDWLDMVERTQAAQPHWMTPLLSPAHQLDAVEHLNREATATATATDAEPAKMAQSRGPQVLTLPTETSAAPWIEQGT